MTRRQIPVAMGSELVPGDGVATRKLFILERLKVAHELG
jgi:hypothetical protein